MFNVDIETIREPAQERAREKRLAQNYNLTPAEAELIYAYQNYVCAICGKKQKSGKRLALDHCHRTGLIRGALCSQCNRVFGTLENRGWTIEHVVALLAYIRNPPAERALGRKVFGYAGRCGTKKHRMHLRREAKRTSIEK